MKRIFIVLGISTIMFSGSCYKQKYNSLESENQQLKLKIDSLEMMVKVHKMLSDSLSLVVLKQKILADSAAAMAGRAKKNAELYYQEQLKIKK